MKSALRRLGIGVVLGSACLGVIMTGQPAHAILPPALAKIQCVALFDGPTSNLALTRERMTNWVNGHPKSDWRLELDDFYGFDVKIRPFIGKREQDFVDGGHNGPVKISIIDRAKGGGTEASVSWINNPNRNRKQLLLKFYRSDTRGPRDQTLRIECESPL